MDDLREKVIKGLECCAVQCVTPEAAKHCGICPYDREKNGEMDFDCQNDLICDAVALLRAQKPKFVPDIAEAIIGCKPKVKVGHCPSCDVLIHETDNFCRKCGQAVKWE